MTTIKKTYSLWSIISNGYFLIFAGIASLIIVFQKLNWGLPPYINNYANDLLCMPIVLYIAQLAVRKLKGDPTLHLPPALILIATLFYSILFEWYLPQINPRYTADSLDVLMYFFGALFFFMVEYKTPKK